jgi:hypothetical protein
MLGFTHSHFQRNVVAFIAITAYAISEWFGLIPTQIQNILMTLSGIVVLYTLIGMRLFDHMNKYQDSKFGEGVYEDETGREIVLKKKPRKPVPKKPIKK